MTVFCSEKENGGRKSFSRRDLRFPDFLFLQLGTHPFPVAASHRCPSVNSWEVGGGRSTLGFFGQLLSCFAGFYIAFPT
jgi:hypothetical protein